MQYRNQPNRNYRPKYLNNHTNLPQSLNLEQKYFELNYADIKQFLKKRQINLSTINKQNYVSQLIKYTKEIEQQNKKYLCIQEEIEKYAKKNNRESQKKNTKILYFINDIEQWQKKNKINQDQRKNQNKTENKFNQQIDAQIIHSLHSLNENNQIEFTKHLNKIKNKEIRKQIQKIKDKLKQTNNQLLNKENNFIKFLEIIEQRGQYDNNKIKQQMSNKVNKKINEIRNKMYQKDKELYQIQHWIKKILKINNIQVRTQIVKPSRRKGLEQIQKKIKNQNEEKEKNEKGYQRKLKDKVDQNDRLNKKMDQIKLNLKNELNKKIEQNDRLNKKMNQMKLDLNNESKQKIGELQNRLSLQQIELNKKIEQNDRLNKKMDQIKLDLNNESKQKIGELQNRLSLQQIELNKKIEQNDRLNKKMNQMKLDLNNQLNKKIEQNDRLNQEIERIKVCFYQHQNCIHRLNSIINNLQTENQQQKKQIQILKQIKEECIKLKDQNQNYQNQIIKFLNLIEQNQILIKQKNDKIQDYIELNQTLKNDLIKLQQKTKSQTFEIQKLNIILKQNGFTNIEKFFVGEILDFKVKERQYLIDELMNRKNKKLKRTKLLYRKDPFNKTNIHEYIDDHNNIVMLVETTNHKIVGAYSEPPFSKKDKIPKGDGMLFSLTNQIHFNLNKQNQSHRPILYDSIYVIFGNSELRLKTIDTNVFSNFAILNNYFETKGKTVDIFFGLGEKGRQAQILNYEFFEVQFEDL